MEYGEYSMGSNSFQTCKTGLISSRFIVAAGLAAFYQWLKVAHVEAGLRTPE